MKALSRLVEEQQPHHSSTRVHHPLFHRLQLTDNKKVYMRDGPKQNHGETQKKDFDHLLASVHVDAYSNHQDGQDDEEDDAVDQNRDSAGVHVAELDHPRSRW
ncbi:unnamed protein product [Musa hybrid cultivar]